MLFALLKSLIDVKTAAFSQTLGRLYNTQVCDDKDLKTAVSKSKHDKDGSWKATCDGWAKEGVDPKGCQTHSIAEQDLDPGSSEGWPTWTTRITPKQSTKLCRTLRGWQLASLCSGL